MPPSQPFSKRKGYIGQPKAITIREDAPNDLRFAILETMREIARAYQGQYPEKEIRDVVAKTLKKWLDPAVWHYQEAWEQVEHAVYDCEWFRVYDLMESVNAYFERTTPAAAEEFAEQLNDLFVEQGIGWQLVNGEIVTRGAEAFEEAVRVAASELQEDQRPTAAGQIHEALQALSRRPKPNVRGAIVHGMGALECVARDVSGDPKAALGDVLKRHPDLLPKPVDCAIAKLWGYASNVARHVEEGLEPGRDEAELTVWLAASIATYLTRKHR